MSSFRCPDCQAWLQLVAAHAGPSVPATLSPSCRAACLSQGGQREQQRVQTLVVPQFGKVEPDGRRVAMAVGFDRLDQPPHAAFDTPRSRRPVCWTPARASTATAVSSTLLRCPSPPQPPSAFCAWHSQATARRAGSVSSRLPIAVGQQDFGRSVDRILLVRVVLVAEPQRNPTAVGPLLTGQVAKAGLDRPLGPLARRQATPNA